MGTFDTGTITGTVMDTQDAALPGATVKTVVNGIPEIQVSDYYGRFRFPNLPPGSYTVEAMLEGFSPATDSGVAVYKGQITTIELKMQLAISE